jgi:2-phospho-L-lactate transferase/gluconeogenesis factor (CofD/UPF0052 family)
MAQRSSPASPEVPGKAATRPKDKRGPIKVRATELGYYDHVRRYPEMAGRPADVFIVDAEDFSPKWMERVPDETPEQVTTAQQALSQSHRETIAAKVVPSLTQTDRDVL